MLYVVSLGKMILSDSKLMVIATTPPIMKEGSMVVNSEGNKDQACKKTEQARAEALKCKRGITASQITASHFRDMHVETGGHREEGMKASMLQD